jgi:YaiO family outer membrane protein
MRRRTRAWLIAATLLAAVPVHPLSAQAPLAGGIAGRTVEVHGLYQRVTGGYGDWRGSYARLILPGASDVLFLDALALEGFGERGVQAGIAHRHDWTSRWFHLLGVNAGDGTPIFPRARVDALVGRRWGEGRTVQTTAGASYVKSVTELYDVAALGNVTWYAPRGFIVETGVRYNSSRPGDIQSHRVHGIAMWTTPDARRSFSTRVIAGTEGWQIVNINTTLTKFASQEVAVAWRERVGRSLATNVQLDAYRNPFYTRAGVTVGVARYW